MDRSPKPPPDTSSNVNSSEGEFVSVDIADAVGSQPPQTRAIDRPQSLSCKGPVSQLFQNGRRPNILFIITDQERALQHWPKNFEEDHLPNLRRLKKHGLTFEQHYTNSCMCSPSRATLLTSLFPATHNVKRTGSPGPPVALSPDLPNLATVLKGQPDGGGYRHVEWHGKWHVGKTPAEYGFDGWQPPDAGNYLSLNDTLGGGEPDNDGRFLDEACRFLQKQAAGADTRRDDEPFCLFVSFVNPHDVYVAQHEVPVLGYTAEDFTRIQVPLPSNLMEDPDENGKPRAQGQMSIRYVPFENEPQDYVNFYAHLHAVVDGQIGTLLDTLDELGLTESTLVFRTADHGEQALSHSLVEKFYNVYQESIHIPFVVSNPVAFPQPRATQALSSHVDILPTLASLLGVQEPSSVQWTGTNLTPVLDDPNASVHDGNVEVEGVQPLIHFTYDDIACHGAPSTVRCIRKRQYKYAVYFTVDGLDADWELYDLDADPLENTNLAGVADYATIQLELEAELCETMKRCGTLPEEFRWPPSTSKRSQGSSQNIAR